MAPLVGKEVRGISIQVPILVCEMFQWIDLARGLGGVYATQILPFADHKALPLFFEFEKTIYEG